jgi:hypothetical protein
MKKLIVFLFAVVLVSGCRSSYDVTLTNGLQFTGVSKPRLNPDRGVYVFRSAGGRTFNIPETRIRTIEPHEKVKESKFNNQSDSQKFNSSGR